MARNFLFAATAAASLAACGTPVEEIGNNALEAAENIVAVDNIAAIVPVEIKPPVNRLPQPFIGRWGLTAEDCTGTAGNNAGLMVIAPDLLTFYESRAAVRGLQAISPTEVRVTLTFTGEGQEWTQETPLILGEDGVTLTRLVDGRKLQYTRCGA
ncbi:hypothetical protein [uncultured Sphingomonas sp.]|uniref:hypothetical protein n=1 Tax=uncultured Sphingomonas sp. TaxID=158754 RepID=UPI0025EC0246|nr:hypothetical protein [uncultured Sphingomonas sp.]